MTVAAPEKHRDRMRRHREAKTAERERVEAAWRALDARRPFVDANDIESIFNAAAAPPAKAGRHYPIFRLGDED